MSDRLDRWLSRASSAPAPDLWPMIEARAERPGEVPAASVGFRRGRSAGWLAAAVALLAGSAWVISVVGDEPTDVTVVGRENSTTTSPTDGWDSLSGVWGVWTLAAWEDGEGRHLVTTADPAKTEIRLTEDRIVIPTPCGPAYMPIAYVVPDQLVVNPDNLPVTMSACDSFEWPVWRLLWSGSSWTISVSGRTLVLSSAAGIGEDVVFFATSAD